MSLHNLELWRLKRFCDVHRLDPHELDNTLTYSENKKHLESLVTDRDRSAEWASEQERYEKEHALSHYVGAILDGSNISDETGPPLEQGFSLIAYIESKRQG